MKTSKTTFPSRNFAVACAAAVSILIAAALTGCDKNPPQPKAELKTVETESAKKEVNDYKANPTATQKAQADRALAALDKEISELEERVSSQPDPEAQSKLDSLRSTRTELTASYAKGEYESVTTKVKDAFKAMGKSISDAAEATAEKVKGVVGADDKKD